MLQHRGRTDLLAADLKGFMAETSDYYRSLSKKGRPDLPFETGRDYLVGARASAIRCFSPDLRQVFSFAFGSKGQRLVSFVSVHLFLANFLATWRKIVHLTPKSLSARFLSLGHSICPCKRCGLSFSLSKM